MAYILDVDICSNFTVAVSITLSKKPISLCHYNGTQSRGSGLDQYLHAFMIFDLQTEAEFNIPANNSTQTGIWFYSAIKSGPYQSHTVLTRQHITIIHKAGNRWPMLLPLHDYMLSSRGGGTEGLRCEDWRLVHKIAQCGNNYFRCVACG